MPYYIYALIDPCTDQIRYVGMTDNFTHRYRGHISCKQPNERKNDWIQGLLDQGLLPSFKILETLYERAEVAKRESYWINHCRSVMGCSLLNIQVGYAGARTVANDEIDLDEIDLFVRDNYGSKDTVMRKRLLERKRSLKLALNLPLEEKRWYTLQELLDGLPYGIDELARKIGVSAGIIAEAYTGDMIRMEQAEALLLHLAWIYSYPLSGYNVTGFGKNDSISHDKKDTPAFMIV